MRAVGYAIGGLALAALLIWGIMFQVHIHNVCGWQKSLLWGKNITWLYMMGYCDE